MIILYANIQTHSTVVYVVILQTTLWLSESELYQFIADSWNNMYCLRGDVSNISKFMKTNKHISINFTKFFQADVMF